MTRVIDQGAIVTSTSAVTTITTPSLTIAAGSVIVILSALRDDVDSQTVVASGATGLAGLTWVNRVKSQAGDPAAGTASVHWAVCPSGGTGTLTLTRGSAVAPQWQIRVLELRGADIISPEIQQVGSYGVGGNTISTYSTPRLGSVLLAVAMRDDTTGLSMASTWSAQLGRAVMGSSAYTMAMDTTLSGTSANFVGTFNNWVVQMIEIADASPGIGVSGVVFEIGTSLGTNNPQPTFVSPSHTGASGDLCLYLVGHDNPGATAITASTGWTVLDLTTQGANVIKGALIARVLDGAMGSGDNTLSVSGATQDYSIIGCIIAAGEHFVSNVSTDMPRGTPSTAVSGNTDPPNDTFSSGNYLVFSGAVVDADVDNAITGWSADYGLLSWWVSANSASSVMTGLAVRPVTGTSADPGAWAHNSQENIGFTFAVPCPSFDVRAVKGLWNSGVRRG